MFLARVTGDLVSTCKHDALRGERLLWVTRVAPDGTPLSATARKPSLACDRVDAGPGDLVLVLDEGNGAAQVLGKSRGPVRTVIVGVVDAVFRDAGRVGVDPPDAGGDGAGEGR